MKQDKTWTKRLQVYITDELYEKVKLTADELGLPVSIYIRNMLIEKFK